MAISVICEAICKKLASTNYHFTLSFQVFAFSGNYNFSFPYCIISHRLDEECRFTAFPSYKKCFLSREYAFYFSSILRSL